MDIQKISSLTNDYINTSSPFLYEQICSEMLPVIYKFSRKLYFMENDDCLQEFFLALYEALLHIKYVHNPYGTFKYLYRCIRNKYLTLYVQNGSEPQKVNLNECNLSIIETGLQTSEFFSDFDICFRLLPHNKKLILMLSAQGYSNAEIGKTLGISRQYVHRVRKKLLNQFEAM